MIERLNNTNRNISETVNRNSENIYKIKSSIEKTEKNISLINKKADEIMFANIFHDTVKNSEWLNIGLSFSGYAIGYNFAYILYRVLNDLQPEKILELGLGQSTKIINEYVKYFGKQINIEYHVVEHNREWASFFKRSADLSDMTNFHFLDCYKRDMNGYMVNAYKDFKEEFNNKSFELICIDAPNGYNQEYSRIDIFDILPSCLEKQFIIILDDCNRAGERRTIKLLEDELSNNNIDFSSSFKYTGKTDVYLCVSKNYEFLCNI